MTSSPNEEKPPQGNPSPKGRPRRSRRIGRWVGWGLGTGLLVGVAGGAAWLYFFVTRDLAPLVAEEIADLVNRPVKIEGVESISLTALTFGASSLPATDSDRDYIDIDQVVASYDVLEILRTRRVGLDILIVNPRAVLDQTSDGKWLSTQFGREEEEEEDKAGPFKVELDTLRIRNGTVTLLPSPTVQEEIGKPEVGTSPGARSNVGFSDINGELSLQSDNQVVTFDVRTNPQTGGRARVLGKLLLEEEVYTFTLRSRGLAASDVSSLIAIPVTLDAGLLTTNMTVVVEGNALRSLNGSARVRDGRALIQDVPQPLNNVQAQVRFRDQRITIRDGNVQYGEIPVAIRGDIDLEEGYDLTADVRDVAFSTIQRTGNFDLPVPIAGNFDIRTTVGGDIDDPDIAGRVQTRGPLRVDKVNLTSAQGNFAIDVDEDGSTLELSNVRAEAATGGTVRGGGSVLLGEAGRVALNFAVRDVQSDAIAQAYGANLPEQIRLGRADADVRVFGPQEAVQTEVAWQLQDGTFPARGEVAIAGGNVDFRNLNAQVGRGTVTGNGRIADERLDASLRASNIALEEFAPQVQGLLNTEVRVSSSLRDLGPGSVRADGDVRLTSGVPFLEPPLEVSFAWLGDRLQIRQATAPGLSASGTVFADLTGTPQISRFDLGVQLQDYNLARVQEFLPEQMQVAGRVTFDGRVSGTPQAPTVDGRLRTNDLMVNNVAFDPVLSGPVAFGLGQGGRIDLTGTQDRIFAEVDSRYRPTAFVLQRGDLLAEGTTEGDRFQAQFANVPLASLNLPPVGGIGTPQGILNGNVAVNLNTLTSSGDIQVSDPGLGYIEGDRLSTLFRYETGMLALRNGELVLGESRFLFGGSVQTQGEQAVRMQIAADPAYVQDVLTALKWFEFEDIGRGFQPPTFSRADDVTTVAVGNPEDSLRNQLRRLAEIQALEAIEEQEQAQGIQIPALNELTGLFTGQVAITGSVQEGINAEFDLTGDNWTWGDYQTDQIIAQGSFQDGAVTLLPLRVQLSDTAALNISGQFGGSEQNGQIQAQNIPMQQVQELLNLPLDITGDLDANVLISGGIENPLARGTVVLEQGSVNQKPLDRARTSFSYTDARLSLIGEVAIPDTSPLRVLGSIPYQFPFMAVEPDSENITLNARVEDDGLALLSLFTDQVAWEGGDGVIDINVTGTLYEPKIVGTATVRDGVISAIALPEPLTQVNGDVQFDSQFIRVQQFQGEFRQGYVTAQGAWPIFDESALPEPGDSDENQPLSLNLTDVVLNFKGLYRGGVNGWVELVGSALAPRITGNIELSNGVVELSTQGPGAGSSGSTPQAGPFEPPRLEDLNIRLGQRLRITMAPILNFVAQGDMVINGPPSDLRPNGTINLRSGQVNLFTSQFGLVRNYNNFARFTPNRGLDPFLDVRLVTTIPEVRRVPTPPTSPFGPNEISETLATDIGAVGTVRVEARVQGPASQLADNLELTSSPARSETEIISLLGGNVVTSLAEGEGDLVIANLASSAVLTQLQNRVNNVLGITDFRLFPTILPEESAAGAGNSGTLELAAELGVDITGQFSASVLTIVTAQAPTQFNLRYRLNDQLLMRGYVDTAGGSGAILEFETRF